MANNYYIEYIDDEKTIEGFLFKQEKGSVGTVIKPLHKSWHFLPLGKETPISLEGHQHRHRKLEDWEIIKYKLLGIL